MGGCVGRNRDRNISSAESSTVSIQHVSVGKNQQLKHEKVKWKSDVPLTDGQLRSKRDEFWDTAPAFEGRKEIWDALKAAVYACECQDYALAQAIIDGANISLPNGTLIDCYDELGNRYQLPVYCLSSPINLIETSCGDTYDKNTGSDSENSTTGVDPAQMTTLKLRLSITGKDTRFNCKLTDTISAVKRKLHNAQGIATAKQRWYYGGKLLNDKLRIEELKIPPSYVIQVVIDVSEDSNEDTIVKS